MARIQRRKFLKFSGAGAMAASAGGGLAAILASGQAPAYAQGASLHWLRWADETCAGAAGNAAAQAGAPPGPHLTHDDTPPGE